MEDQLREQVREALNKSERFMSKNEKLTLENAVVEVIPKVFL